MQNVCLFCFFLFYVRTRYLYPAGPWIPEYVLNNNNNNKRSLSPSVFFLILFWPNLPSLSTLLHLTGHSVYLCLASSSHCWPEEIADGSGINIELCFFLKAFKARITGKENSIMPS